MNSSCPPDTSLYELAVSTDQPPQPLQISPTTLKSMMSTFFDLLIDCQLPVTVWMKLPKGEVWQAEVDRFRQLANAPYSLYLLQTQREDNSEKIEGEPLVASAKLDSKLVSESGDESDTKSNLSDISGLSGLSDIKEAGELADPLVDATTLINDRGIIMTNDHEAVCLKLPLAAESQLRREYFLLALSANFCGLILAHRPRTIRHRKAESLAGQEPRLAAPVKLPEEDTERRHPLLGICSFESSTIQRILEGIHRAVCYGQTIGQTAIEPIAEAEAEAEALLVNWDQIVSPLIAGTPDPLILGHLFTKQVQRQEEIWLSSVNARRQADTASTLQLENEKLLNAIRLKDEFLKNVGQELRTPLSTMKTALTLLNSPSIKPPQRQRYMEMISQECDRQSSLITSVLDLIQLESSDEQNSTQPLRLTEVVPGVVSTYQPLAQEKGILLAYTIPEELPAVSCLNTWLRQIVINLLHNGIKFTPKGGQVWVRAKQQGDYVQIEFRDTGIGIPTVEIPKIFDRFYRVRQGGSDETGGAGLGLSIVQQLLLRCGGSISVKSKPGEGTAFNVLLPIYH